MLTTMLEVIMGLVVGLIIGAVAISRGPLVTKKYDPWRPVSSIEIRKKLKREGTLDAFVEGRIYCPICKKPVTFGNLWSIMEDDESQDFICRDPGCFRAYLRAVHEGMVTA